MTPTNHYTTTTTPHINQQKQRQDDLRRIELVRERREGVDTITNSTTSTIASTIASTYLSRSKEAAPFSCRQCPHVHFFQDYLSSLWWKFYTNRRLHVHGGELDKA
jgi:hypothetical protein